jgi:hypothetical protein
MGSIPVSHCFTVSGEGMCIEAHAGTGVAEAKLSKYFDDEHCHVFFRKPRCWNMVSGYTQRDLVWGQIGCEYDFGAVCAAGLTGTIAGRFVNEAGFGVPEELIGRLLQDDKRWMCSELSSYALKKVYGEKGCLAKPTYCIEPQELFEDGAVFEDWKK